MSLNRLIYASGQVVFDGATSESSSRTDADSTLQSSINSEASARASSDSSLTSSLSQEITARSNADSTLLNSLQPKWNIYPLASSQALEANDRVLANTTAGSIAGTLPANPSLGAEIQILDARGSFGTYAFTLVRNGKLIGGVDADYELDVSSKMYGVVFIDDTYGWAVYQ